MPRLNMGSGKVDRVVSIWLLTYGLKMQTILFALEESKGFCLHSVDKTEGIGGLVDKWGEE